MFLDETPILNASSVKEESGIAEVAGGGVRQS